MVTCTKCERKATRRGLCNKHYENHRSRMNAYGRWETGYTNAEPVRAHIQALRDAGVGSRKVHELSGVSRTTITALMTGRPFRGTGPSSQVYKSTAEKLLAIPVPLGYEGRALGANIDATGTIRRLRALVAIGYAQNDIAKRMGWSATNASKLFIGSQTRVTTATARVVAELFDALSMTPGPSDRARNHARKHGWAPPLAWDDDAIDNPAATADLGTRQPISFGERYLELRELGFNDLQILGKLKIKPESLHRQILRYGLTVSPELASLASSQKHHRQVAS
jgi:transcriptional regulator with XRE-family HTH domain